MPPSDRSAGYGKRLFVAVAFGAMAAQTGRVVISPLLPTIIDELAITPFAAGLALSLMWALSAAFQYFGGRFSDLLSHKTVLAAAVGCIVLGFATLGLTTLYPLFVLGTAVIGVGIGLYNTAAYAQMADLFTERRGTAFGGLSASMDLGAALASGVATVVLAVAVWQTAFLPLLLVMVVVLAAMHVLNDESYVLERPSLNVRETAGRIFGTPSVRLSLVCLGGFAFVWQGLASFLPTYLQLERGIAPAPANAAFTGLFVVGIVARPLLGDLGDRMGHLTVATIVPLLTAAGLVLVLVGPSFPVIVGGILLLGGGLSAFFVLVQTDVMNRFPVASMGGDFGATRTVFVGIGSLGPAYIGFAAERVGYTGAFVGLLVVIGGTFLLLLQIRRQSGSTAE